MAERGLGQGGAPAQSPARLGKYRIVRCIAHGGMAEVFHARSIGIEGFEKDVALKRIHPHLARENEFVDMFLDEARISATLQHPNIAQVYDVGVDDGSYFFAMELLEGLDMARVLRLAAKLGHPLPREHAIAAVIGACAGLHYAHERTTSDGSPLGIVHRDVSPHNLFVTQQGGVKLVDFGIAKAARRITQTEQGTLKGKIRYMSPEQCAGDVLDRRSDVFSLSIVLWEMTTGAPLYHGDGDYKIMKAITESDAPRPSTVRADYPAALEAIVMKGLARDREERYASAEALQLALESFAREARLSTSSVELGRFVRKLVAEGGELFDEQVPAEPGAPPRIVAGSSSSEVEQRTRPLLSPLAAAEQVERPQARVRRARVVAPAALIGIGLILTAAIALRSSSPAPPSAAPTSSLPPSIVADSAPSPKLTTPSPPVAPVTRPATPAPAPTPSRSWTAKRPQRTTKSRARTTGTVPAPRWDPSSPLPPP